MKENRIDLCWSSDYKRMLKCNRHEIYHCVLCWLFMVSIFVHPVGMCHSQYLQALRRFWGYKFLLRTCIDVFSLLIITEVEEMISADVQSFYSH